MFDVIDTFVVSDRMAGDSADRGIVVAVGLWAVLRDLPAVIDLPASGEMVTIVRPDDSEIRAEVSESEVRHRAAAVCFRTLRPEDVPPLSRIVRDQQFVRLAAEELVREMTLAWEGAEPPAVQDVTVHRCLECDEITAFFGSTRWYDHVDVDTLRRNEAALTLFTPQAFHHYLPAFMRATLRSPADADVIPNGIRFNLKRAVSSADSPVLRLFSGVQRRSVARFLRLLPALGVAEEFDVAAIAQELEKST